MHHDVSSIYFDAEGYLYKGLRKKIVEIFTKRTPVSCHLSPFTPTFSRSDLARPGMHSCTSIRKNQQFEIFPGVPYLGVVACPLSKMSLEIPIRQSGIAPKSSPSKINTKITLPQQHRTPNVPSHTIAKQFPLSSSIKQYRNQEQSWPCRCAVYRGQEAMCSYAYITVEVKSEGMML